MPKSKTTVSVIIAAYNSSGTLRLALQTVLWQDFNDFDVWVIGDGCTDDSGEVVASFNDDRLHWTNLPFNSGGPSLPRDEGFRLAAGRYVAYIGQDDLWFPWHLSELVNCIESSNSDFVYSLGAIMAPGGVIATFSLAHDPWSRNEIISPINWLHRKNLTDVIGSWSTGSKYGDDQEFLRRLLVANVRLGFCRQLSVLKFPAAMWRIYSIKNDFPQAKYSELLRHDALKLRNDLLIDFAAFGSVAHKPIGPLYKRLINRTREEVFRLYGMNRWPLNQFLYQRYRRWAGLDSSEEEFESTLPVSRDEMLHRDASKSDPLSALLEAYWARSDLISAFPEVKDGDYKRLIQWASHVIMNRIDAYARLEPYADWYRTRTI